MEKLKRGNTNSSYSTSNIMPTYTLLYSYGERSSVNPRMYDTEISENCCFALLLQNFPRFLVYVNDLIYSVNIYEVAFIYISASLSFIRLCKCIPSSTRAVVESKLAWSEQQVIHPSWPFQCFHDTEISN